ncbi:putative protein N(5)-glutamine methyltransferase [Georgenia alba]|uniref:Methyltransferase small domain-containing protein n=1 Tax=Georgenia alba TaxID=2233858 RepID=A0ABW2Q843_9MICO
MATAERPAETDPDAALAARLRAAGCVFAEEEATLLRVEAGSPETLETMVARRVGGEPLEQVLGWAELGGVRVDVAPGVFVPRRRSALLVRLAVDQLRAVRDAVVVDLGCGTGALAAAVLRQVGDAEVWASDVDPDAVACARRNLPPERVLLGDLYDPLPENLRGRVDVLLANAPYVPTDQIARMPTEARDHEHRVALDGGGDGLDVQRRVIAGAPDWLAPGGILLLECSAGQATAAAALVRAARLAASIHDEEEIGATAVLGRSGTMDA